MPLRASSLATSATFGDHLPTRAMRHERALVRAMRGVPERRVPAVLLVPGMADDEAGAVTGKELSGAVVAYLRGPGLPFPHQSIGAVEEALGTHAAARLRPRLESSSRKRRLPGQLTGIITISCRQPRPCSRLSLPGTRSLTRKPLPRSAVLVIYLQVALPCRRPRHGQ